jgi:hypothetical protein
MESRTSVVRFSAEPSYRDDPKFRCEYVDLNQEINVCQFLGTEQMGVMEKRERERERERETSPAGNQTDISHEFSRLSKKNATIFHPTAGHEVTKGEYTYISSFLNLSA